MKVIWPMCLCYYYLMETFISFNHSINHSINQSIIQSIIQSFIQSTILFSSSITYKAELTTGYKWCVWLKISGRQWLFFSQTQVFMNSKSAWILLFKFTHKIKSLFTDLVQQTQYYEDGKNFQYLDIELNKIFIWFTQFNIKKIFFLFNTQWIWF